MWQLVANSMNVDSSLTSTHENFLPQCFPILSQVSSLEMSMTARRKS
jgi:hypothetical protein